MINSETTVAWENWIEVTRSRCHLHFELDGGTLHSHIIVGRDVGRNTAARIAEDLPGMPSSILEVGSSVGFNCLALAERFPSASIVGIEPDVEACALASAMGNDFDVTNVEFIVGVGERLPFPDASFDWIICHTVIEHVNDVNVCIAEMARVLRPGGFLHLDAPNYLWPWEPHLRILMPPLCPKPLMRMLARLQGAGSNLEYAEHLKLVHPAWMERRFTLHGLSWFNRVESKLHRAAVGDHAHIAAYGRSAIILSVLSRIGLSKILIFLLLHMRLYPSLLYTVIKPQANKKSLP
jgi:SAM-dependent methyltransferase